MTAPMQRVVIATAAAVTLLCASFVGYWIWFRVGYTHSQSKAFEQLRQIDQRNENMKANADFMDEIAALKLLPNEPAAPIQMWDDQVVVTTYDKSGLHYFRVSGLKVEHFRVPGLDQVLFPSYANRLPIILGRSSGELRLLRKQGGVLKEVPLPAALKDVEWPLLIPSTDGIAVMVDPSLYLYRRDQWTKVEIPKVPKFYREFEPDYPRERYLVGSKLFASWNHGEWGGMLTSFDVDQPNDGWKEISGKKQGDDTGIIGNQGITGMTVDSSGKFWVSEGCAHMGGMWRGLYRYDGKRWETIVYGFFDKAEGGKVSFPGETTDITSIFSNDGGLYVLGGALGIFRYDNQSLKPVVEVNFYGISQPHVIKVESEKIDTIIPCYPNGLVVDPAGKLFVSTSYYGILCFVPDGEKYHLRQIILPGSKETEAAMSK